MNSFMATSMLAGSQFIGKSNGAFRAGRELLLFAHGGTRHVDGYVAAADDHHLFADGETVAKIYVQKKIDALHDAVQLMPRKIQVAAAVQAEREQHGFVTLAAEIFQRKVTTEPHVEAKFRAQVENFANLRLQDIARQTGIPECRDASFRRALALLRKR